MKKLNGLIKVQAFLLIICVILLICAIEANAYNPPSTQLTCPNCMNERTFSTCAFICDLPTYPGLLPDFGSGLRTESYYGTIHEPFKPYKAFNPYEAVKSYSVYPVDSWDTGSFTDIWNPMGYRIGAGFIGTSLSGINIGTQVGTSFPTNIWDTGSFTDILWNPTVGGIIQNNIPTFVTCNCDYTASKLKGIESFQKTIVGGYPWNNTGLTCHWCEETTMASCGYAACIPSPDIGSSYAPSSPPAY